jgi:hypothetical protein
MPGLRWTMDLARCRNMHKTVRHVNDKTQQFHDLLRKDGTPFDPREKALFQALTDRR